MHSESLMCGSSTMRARIPSSIRRSRFNQIRASEAEPSTATSAALRRPIPRMEASSLIISRIERPGRNNIAFRSFSVFFCSSLAMGATVGPRHSNIAAVALAASRKSEHMPCPMLTLRSQVAPPAALAGPSALLSPLLMLKTS
eukprot:scaffold242773_cov31-Tisochrysis_lutea.AAC.2